MSYMIETDVPVCVLICLDVNVGFQDQILVKIRKKWPIWPPKFQKSILGALILCWDIANDSLRSYMIETDLPVCVLIFLDVYVGFQDQKLVKNKQKIADLAP